MAEEMAGIDRGGRRERLAVTIGYAVDKCKCSMECRGNPLQILITPQGQMQLTLSGGSVGRASFHALVLY